MDFVILIFEIICEGWFHLMQLILPEKMKNKSFSTMLKILVRIYCIALLVCMLLGVIYMLSNDENSRVMGRYMVYIPLAISVVQIIGGVVVRIRNKN